jgi:hypothetical protein
LEFRSEPFFRTEKHSEFYNFIPNHSAEFHSEPFRSREKHSEFRSDPLSEKIFWNLRSGLLDAFLIYEMKSLFCIYDVYSVKPHFFAEFVSFRTLKWGIPRRTEFRGMSIYFRGITKTDPSLFRRIFRNGISMATLVTDKDTNKDEGRRRLTHWRI